MLCALAQQLCWTSAAVGLQPCGHTAAPATAPATSQWCAALHKGLPCSGLPHRPECMLQPRAHCWRVAVGRYRSARHSHGYRRHITIQMACKTLLLVPRGSTPTPVHATLLMYADANSCTCKCYLDMHTTYYATHSQCRLARAAGTAGFIHFGARNVTRNHACAAWSQQAACNRAAAAWHAMRSGQLDNMTRPPGFEPKTLKSPSQPPTAGAQFHLGEHRTQCLTLQPPATAT
jgi:hypothetical protein